MASDAFVKWLGAYPNVRLNAHTLQEPWRAWNIKPRAMLADKSIDWAKSSLTCSVVSVNW